LHSDSSVSIDTCSGIVYMTGAKGSGVCHLPLVMKSTAADTVLAYRVVAPQWSSLSVVMLTRNRSGNNHDDGRCGWLRSNWYAAMWFALECASVVSRLCHLGPPTALSESVSAVDNDVNAHSERSPSASSDNERTAASHSPATDARPDGVVSKMPSGSKSCGQQSVIHGVSVNS